MSVLEFISSLVGSIAWPSAVVAIIFLLRRHAPQFIAALRKMTLPGGVEFELDQVRDAVVQLANDTTPGAGGPTAAIAALAESPTELIQRKFDELESVLRATLQPSDPDAAAGTFHQLMQGYADRGTVGARIAEASRTLQAMRVAAMHGNGWSPSSGDAAEFALLSNAVIALLPGLGI